MMLKKKLLQTLLAVIVCLAAAFACIGVAACSQDYFYTVRFEMLGHGTAPESQTVVTGGHSSKPATDPQEEGWTFGGWYKEVGCTNEFIFENEAITSDTTVYAKWTEDTSEPEPETYQVTFDMQGHGTAPAAQTVTEGEKATAPETEPSAEGWTFGGWYKEEACTNVFDFATETITKATTVYAKWTEVTQTPEPETYQVTFDMQGHGTAPAAQTVTEGEKATEPETQPSAEGWTFGGWYKEEACTNVFDFETETITKATTVYAKWTEVTQTPEPETYQVTFDMQGHGTAPAAQTVTEGEKATEPETQPEAEGWTFGGWYKEEACTNVFDFETETITKATTVYAKWTEVTEQPGPVESTPLTGKIYIVGDSTVCSFNDAYYMPRYGYGTQLANYLNVTDANTQIVNLALSGRSSLSFLSENNYTTLKNSIASGDYLIIGFGHNDEKSDEAARYTDANGTYNVATTANGPSFQYTLYENYVKLAKDKGATPILCTPIVRYDSAFSYSGAKVHDTTSSDKLGKGGDYSAAIRELGKATGTTVIDLTALTQADYKELRDEAIYYHAHTTYEGTKPNETPAGRDDTHINMYGAKTVAYYIASELLKTDCTLKNHVKADITRPTRQNDFEGTVNSNYVKPDYTPFNPANYASKNLGEISGQNWYSTAMGDVGGAGNIGKFTISKNSENITVSNTTNHGKIASASDGFAAAFVQVDASKNFNASATVTIKGKTANVNKQSAFGIMLRDDIFVDSYIANISSNYVVAGALGDGSVIFSRENSKQSIGSDKTTVNVDSTYTVSIQRVGQTVTVNFSDGTKNYTKKYTDFDFVAVDNGYMYVCLIANRGLTVEYSDISFEITGDAQGA